MIPQVQFWKLLGSSEAKYALLEMNTFLDYNWTSTSVAAGLGWWLLGFYKYGSQIDLRYNNENWMSD